MPDFPPETTQKVVDALRELRDAVIDHIPRCSSAFALVDAGGKADDALEIVDALLRCEEGDLGQREPTLSEVEEVVCAVLGIDGHQLRSRSRNAPAVHRRHVFWFVARTVTSRSLTDCGDWLRHGSKTFSHATVLNAQRNLSADDPDVAKCLKRLRKDKSPEG